MKRLRRWLFNVLAGVSLLLCVATVAMWVRSYWRVEWIGHYERCHYHTAHDPSRPSTSQPLHFYGTSAGMTTRRAVKLGYLGGRVYLVWTYSPTPAERIIDKTEWRWEAHIRANDNRSQPSWKYLGFSYRNRDGKGPRSPESSREFAIPQWFILFLAGLLPGCWIIAMRKRRRQAFRQANNLCFVCGYDLRATPDRCPECGTIPEKSNKISK